MVYLKVTYFKLKKITMDAAACRHTFANRSVLQRRTCLSEPMVKRLMLHPTGVTACVLRLPASPSTGISIFLEFRPGSSLSGVPTGLYLPSESRQYAWP